MDARELTPIFYYPAPTSVGYNNGEVTKVVTSTVTVTATNPTGALPTITQTFGVPWTTATPLTQTYTGYGLRPTGPTGTGSRYERIPTAVNVRVLYPPQPRFWQSVHCDNPAGKIVGGVFGGLGLGLLICAIMAFFFMRRIRQLKRAAGSAALSPVDVETRSQSSDWSEGRKSLLKYLTPRNGSPAGSIRLEGKAEDEPLLGRSEGNISGGV